METWGQAGDSLIFKGAQNKFSSLYSCTFSEALFSQGPIKSLVRYRCLAKVSEADFMQNLQGLKSVTLGLSPLEDDTAPEVNLSCWCLSLRVISHLWNRLQLVLEIRRWNSHIRYRLLLKKHH